MNLYKNPTVSGNPTSNVWNVDTAAPCDRYYFTPNGATTSISVYFTGQQGGAFRISCKVYNGSTLLETTSYSLQVYP